MIATRKNFVEKKQSTKIVFSNEFIIPKGMSWADCMEEDSKKVLENANKLHTTATTQPILKKKKKHTYDLIFD